MAEIGISDVRSITSLVKESFGLDLGVYVNSYLIRRLKYLTESRSLSVASLINSITDGVLKKEDLTQVFRLSCTDIFRDPSFWRMMKKLVLELGEKERLKIWVADDFSGQELIAMLITLRETGLLSKAEVHATAMDMNMLEYLKGTNIPLRSMEQSCSNYRKWKESESADLFQHFSSREGMASVDQKLINDVKFSVTDFSKAELPTGSFDIILCRNVMINFNLNHQVEYLKVLHKKLKYSGLLAIGTFDNISRTDEASMFKLISQEEKIYKKIGE